MEIIRGVEQGSKEWKAMRLGVITASKFKDVLAKGAGKTRKSYMYQLAAEVITGNIQEHYKNDAMQHGTDTEPQARAMYELKQGCEVEEVSFVKLDGHCVGVSPDGLTDCDRVTNHLEAPTLVEFKCPNTTTQIETFLSGKMPATHKPQVQGQMWVCQSEFCDFVSFDPRINGAASWFCERIYRDEEYIKNLELEVFKFESELNKLIETLKG